MYEGKTGIKLSYIRSVSFQFMCVLHPASDHVMILQIFANVSILRSTTDFLKI